VKWVRERAELEFDPQGNLLGGFGTVQDVSERKRAEQAVRAGEERLRQAQKMESIGLLAGGVAHDFNNLLAAILGNASLLCDEIGEKSRERLDAIIRATEKAADLTRQLLAYAGRGRLVVESLDLSSVVRDMTELLRTSVPKKVDLQLALEADLPGIDADRGQLQQIVMNLLLNAAEAIGPDQTGTVTISTGRQEVSDAVSATDEITGEPIAPGNYVRLEVADTGCGMDHATRARIFDPFFTTKFLGRGLGLAAVAGTVQSHRGGIELETEPAVGTTFRVYLPVGAAVPVPGRMEQPPAALRGSETILLVDDEELVRSFARHALERQGYRVLEAVDGSQAVQVFRQNAETVSLVLLDLAMPVMSGDETIGVLRSELADLKVVLMSGYNEAEAMRRFAGKGVAGFLQKPFTPSRLAQEVKTVLTRAR
jgi:signal transduction histidine kinase/CheY-like chemotaxis protein